MTQDTITNPFLTFSEDEINRAKNSLRRGDRQNTQQSNPPIDQVLDKLLSDKRSLDVDALSDARDTLLRVGKKMGKILTGISNGSIAFDEGVNDSIKTQVVAFLQTVPTKFNTLEAGLQYIGDKTTREGRYLSEREAEILKLGAKVEDNIGEFAGGVATAMGTIQEHNLKAGDTGQNLSEGAPNLKIDIQELKNALAEILAFTRNNSKQIGEIIKLNGAAQQPQQQL